MTTNTPAAKETPDSGIKTPVRVDWGEGSDTPLLVDADGLYVNYQRIATALNAQDDIRELVEAVEGRLEQIAADYGLMSLGTVNACTSPGCDGCYKRRLFEVGFKAFGQALAKAALAKVKGEGKGE